MRTIAVIIPTLNRKDKLQKCVESIKEGSLADVIELFISVDYPPSDKYVPGYEDVCAYVENISGFYAVNKYFQKQNLGPDQNYLFLEHKAEEHGYDEIIFSEDDIEFSKNGIEYIYKGLERFRNDPNIMAICASSLMLKNGSNYNYYMAPYLSAYGYGYWVSKQKLIRAQLRQETFDDLRKDCKKLVKLFIANKRAFWIFALDLRRKIPAMRDETGELQEIDWSIEIIYALNGWNSVFPVLRKSRNWGFDGSGVNSSVLNRKTNEIYIDENTHFEYKGLPTSKDCYDEWKLIERKIMPSQMEMLKAIWYVIVGYFTTKR